jgi:D-glycero-D-manno-heptose 1,7-bisphosphate phosphatase
VSRKAIFLDRDGVLNKAFIRQGRPHPPSTVKDLEILPGVVESLISLKNVGYFLSVITNQPDIARGIIDKQVVNDINEVLKAQLAIDEIKVCSHDDVDSCFCRKPKPGLILESAKEHNISLADSFFIGDRWRDIEAGKAAGCKTFFIDYGYLEKQPLDFDFKVKSLKEAAQIILGEFHDN